MRARLIPPLLLVVAVIASYLSTLRVPFIFDDLEAIAGNAALRTLWPLPLTYPEELRGITVAGRPLLGYTFALNYATGGLDVRHYHATNIFIHCVAALTLFGLLRLTLRSKRAPARYRGAAFPLALSAALLWAVHPLLTQAVTYTVQRAESLMGLLFLLVLYCLARSAESRKEGAWLATSAALCLLGAGVKEVIAVAPVAALLYDRAFISGSFREALKLRYRYYAAMSLTWPLIAVLLGTTGMHSGSVGAAAGLGWVEYLQLQGWAIARYLKLAFWPTDQVFDYGRMTWMVGRWETVAAGFFTAALLGIALYLLFRRPKVGYAPGMFFLILAPTSSVIPVLDPVVEHRMYLPLASVCVLVILALYELLRRMRDKGAFEGRMVWRMGCATVGALAISLGLATVARNELYNSPEGLWVDTLVKSPKNSRAALSIGLERMKANDEKEAARMYRQAISLNPDDSDAHFNYGVLLMRGGDLSGAAVHFAKAVEVHPRYNTARFNLALALIGLGRPLEAAEKLRECLIFQPGEPRVLFELGKALSLGGKSEEGIGFMAGAVNDAAPRESFEILGDALTETGRNGEAIAYYKAAAEKARAAEDLPAAKRLEMKLAKPPEAGR